MVDLSKIVTSLAGLVSIGFAPQSAHDVSNRTISKIDGAQALTQGHVAGFRHLVHPSNWANLCRIPGCKTTTSGDCAECFLLMLSQKVEETSERDASADFGKQAHFVDKL